MRCHGALVEVHGVGVLLLGPSGIGKSECALELLRRGHRLIADDVVEIERVGPDGAVGRAPEAIRHHLEIRGLGILSVVDLFGPGSVRDSGPVELICHLDPPSAGREYERVGMDRLMEELAGVKLPSVTIPARPAGSVATIVEVAARDQRLRERGINPAARLDARIREEMKRR